MGQLRDKMEADLLLAGHRPHTCRTYLGVARRLAAFHRRSPAEMGIEQVRQFLLHLVRGQKIQRSTQRTYGAALRFLFGTTLGRPDVAARIPLPRAPRKVPEVLSGREVERVLAALSSLRHRAILTVAYGAGLRISEACALRVKDIDSRRMQLHVADGKGGKSRSVPLSRRLLQLLRHYYRLTRPQGEYLFASMGCIRPITARAVSFGLARAVQTSGIRKRVVPHTMRHCFATHLLELGTDVRAIQVFLGHSSIHSTAHYLKVSRRHAGRQELPLDVLGTKRGRLLG